MTSSAIKKQVTTLRAQMEALITERVTWHSALDAAYTADPFVNSDATAARNAIAHLDRALDDIGARVSALEARLPSADDVARVQAQVDTLVARGREAEARYHAAWPVLLTAMETAEAQARVVSTTAEEVSRIICEASDLVRAYGVSADLPRLPTPASVDMQLASHIALLLQDVAQGCPPDTTVETYLAAIRHQRAAVAS